MTGEKKPQKLKSGIYANNSREKKCVFRLEKATLFFS
jgi:hypothetical protein